MSNKFSVGSIEEDFKRIGLIPGVVVEKVSTAADVVAEDVNKPAATETPSAAATSGTAEEVEETPGEQIEGLKLLRKKRPTGKLRATRRKAKMLRRRNKGKLKLKAKRFRKSARGKRFLRKYRMAMKRFHGHAPKGKRLSLKMGLDRVASMLEDVQEIVTAIDGDAKQETIKSFANLALIANKLAESFAFASANVEIHDENDEELDLAGGAKHFESLAAGAADVAEALQASMQEGKEFEGTEEEIAKTFSAMLNDVLEGLDVFADLTEDEEAEESAEAGAEEDVEEDEEPTEEDDKSLKTRTQRDMTLDDEPPSKDKKAHGPNDKNDDGEDDTDDDVEKDNDDDDASPDNTSNVDDTEEKKKARPTK